MQMRHFRYFIAAAEAGSFLRAASVLRVAQPSLSRQIRDLEREVGVTLFERMPRGVRLTRAGDAFLTEARNTVESAARAVASARHEGAEHRTLRVAHGTLYYYARAVSRMLGAFREVNQDTNVTIHRLHEDKQRAALREHRVDVAIAFIGTDRVDGLGTIHLANAQVTGVLLPARHPLAGQEEISLADLHDLTWLRVSRRATPDLYRQVKAALLDRGLVPTRELPRPRDPAIADLHVAAGNAWMLAPEDIGKTYIDDNPAVVFRRFVEPPIPCWLALLYLPDASSPVVDKLVKLARELRSPPL
jgi:DNA-binding transcriptional LysR family regulator